MVVALWADRLDTETIESMAEAILAWCATDAEIAAELGDLHPGETDEAWIREMHAMGDKLRALHAAQEKTR